MNKIALAILAAFSASVVLADDFKTVDGKEYKDAKVSRVEPDGVVLITKSGISKVYFTELPKKVQERFHYDPQKAAEFTSQTVEQNRLFLQQRTEEEQKRAEERKTYWSENPMPQVGQGKLSTFGGSSLDQHGYNQSTTAYFLCLQYAENEIAADKKYRGHVLSIAGYVKTVSMEGETAVVELFVPLWGVGKTWYMRCYFNDASGLEKYQGGNSISFTGTVGGGDYKTLEIKDCHLIRG